LLREVVASIFNLESKFAKTILNIWRPVYLTRAYIKGERKHFLNPGRLFIVSFFLLSALLSIFLKSERENIADNNLGQDLYRSEFREEMLAKYDTLVKWYPTVPQTNMDTIRHELFMSERSMAKDSVSLPPLFRIYGYSEVEKGDFKISTKDIRELSKEELFEKYKVEKLVNQILFFTIDKVERKPYSIRHLHSY
jgi:hypothetical protein